MKQPRTSDFDPSAKGRELKSPLTSFPPIESPNQIPQEGGSQEVLPVRGVRVVLPASLVTSGRRKIKPRHPFDIYEDQDEALRQFSTEDRMRGWSGSMSAMAREALDDFIAKRRAQARPLQDV